MPSLRRTLPTLVCAAVLASSWTSALGCQQERAPRASATAASIESAESRAERERAEREAEIARTHPWHGLARAKQLRLQREPDRASPVVGWLRRGTRIRVKPEEQRGPGCTEGWFEVHPRGYACRGTDILVGETPPEPSFYDPPPALDAPLPYDYFYVSRAYAPQFLRSPTNEELAATAAYVRRLRHFTEEDPTKLERFLAGRIPDEPTKPAVVHDFLARGYFIASPHEDERSGQRFVRTVQGRFLVATHVEPRRGSSFQGFRLDDGTHTLPIPIANRPAQLQRAVPRDGGTLRFVDDPEHTVQRYQVIEGYVRRERLGDFMVHRIGEDRFLKEWFVSVIKAVAPDFAVGENEAWIHVDLSEQTLVLYRGRTPIFGTLVSTGVPGHDTPRGMFRVERKFRGDTMSNIGPEAGDGVYRIEDVPWTQYFRDSFALHAAFWHDRFGIPRSHGCVNLSPQDAHFIFSQTAPTVPEGWHGVPTAQTTETGTRVWITP